MVLLKPRRGLHRLMFGSDKLIDPLAEGRIGQHALELVPRNRLQDSPRVIGKFPQRRIKLPPHFVGAMTPRPAHVEGQLSEGIEPLDFRGQKAIDRVADTGLFAHGFSLGFGPGWVSGRCGDAASASLTIVWASCSIRRKWVSSRKLSAYIL